MKGINRANSVPLIDTPIYHTRSSLCIYAVIMWAVSGYAHLKAQDQGSAKQSQSAEMREEETHKMVQKRQSAEFREREAQAKAAKRQYRDNVRPEFREREAQAKALKHQCPEVRERSPSLISDCE